MNPKNVKAISGLVASTTQTQAGGLLLDVGTQIHRASTVGSAADAFRLPPAIAGKTLVFTNAAAANACGVFPAVGDAINALAANAVYSVAANKTVLFVCAVDGTWNTILTA
jgi:hypothetical protein